MHARVYATVGEILLTMRGKDQTHSTMTIVEIPLTTYDKDETHPIVHEFPQPQDIHGFVPPQLMEVKIQ